MDYESAKKELESYGDLIFYYDSLKKTIGVLLNQEKTKEFERILEEANIKKELIITKIAKLESPYNAIMHYKYILLMKYPDIAKKLSYSVQHIRRLICKGITLYQ